MTPGGGPTEGDGRPVRGRARIGLGVLALLAVGYLAFGPHAPKDNTLRIHLGARAPAVTALELRYRDGDEEVRATELRFSPGHAPRVLSQEVRLPPKEYVLEIGIVSDGTKNTVEKRVRLEGSTTQVELPDPARRDAP